MLLFKSSTARFHLLLALLLSPVFFAGNTSGKGVDLNNVSQPKAMIGTVVADDETGVDGPVYDSGNYIFNVPYIGGPVDEVVPAPIQPISPPAPTSPLPRTTDTDNGCREECRHMTREECQALDVCRAQN